MIALNLKEEMTLPHADFLLKRDPKGFMTFLFTKLKLKFEDPMKRTFGESGAKVIEILDPIFQKPFLFIIRFQPT